MNDLQLTQIIQRIEGEDFAWWLHILVDGRVQALWREAISGAINRTFITAASSQDDLEELGRHVYRLRLEIITTIDDVEYQLEQQVGRCIVRWLDADSGLVRKACVRSEAILPALITEDEILYAVHTPIFWMD